MVLNALDPEGVTPGAAGLVEVAAGFDRVGNHLRTQTWGSAALGLLPASVEFFRVWDALRQKAIARSASSRAEAIRMSGDAPAAATSFVDLDQETAVAFGGAAEIAGEIGERA
jgi:hypothetical protein